MRRTAFLLSDQTENACAVFDTTFSHKVFNMIVIPVDIEALVQCAILAVIFEALRMGIAFFLARPSNEILKLESDKFDAQAEVAKIKSVQLEFVKHSLLTRKVISIEKKIEGLQALYYPRLLFVRKVCRIVRVGFCIASQMDGIKPILMLLFYL